MAVSSTISQIQSAAATAQASSSKSSTSSLGKDDFLKLLTTQLQQQDPTQPMDSTAFIAQLAQFSTLEQMNNANDTLTKMLAAQSTALQTTSASFLGKKVVSTSGDLSLTEGGTATITATLSQAATNVNLVIKDSSGTTVRTVGLGACSAGANTFTWDGLDDNGNKEPTGAYTVEVAATDASGNSVSVTQSSTTTITGVTFASDGTPTFVAGSSTLKLSDISELDE